MSNTGNQLDPSNVISAPMLAFTFLAANAQRKDSWDEAFREALMAISQGADSGAVPEEVHGVFVLLFDHSPSRLRDLLDPDR